MSLLLAVLAASLVGSLHCASMCGGFATAVSAAGGRGGLLRYAVLYHGGRLLGYLVLGVVAGSIGMGLGAATGFQRAAGVLTGVILFGLALHTLFGDARPAVPLVRLRARPKTPGPLQRVLARLLGRGGSVAAAGIGLGSSLLPCGFLWAYVAVAGATSSIGLAALVMAVFWLGTVPALLSINVGVHWLRGRLGRHGRRVTAVVLLGLGTLALTGRLTAAPLAPPTDSPRDGSPPCHHR